MNVESALSARWAAVIVNHNAGPLLETCVRSVVDAGAAKIVVVDNASTDGSLGVIGRSGLPVEIVRLGRNAGYATAANAGTAHTVEPVVAVLNPDTVLGTGFSRLLDRFDEQSVAAVGPRILDPDGSLYPSARSVPSTLDAVGHGLFGLAWPRNPFTRRYRQLDQDPERSRDVDWVSGAAIWLRREALDAVGGWDERYFMYVEDVDLCWRLRSAGWRIVYEPEAEVVHVQGAMTSRRPYRMLVEHHRSLFRFAAKRWRGVKRLLLVPAAAYLTLRAVLAMAHHALRRGSGAASRRE